jgi:hypothetical protein
MGRLIVIGVIGSVLAVFLLIALYALLMVPASVVWGL